METLILWDVETGAIIRRYTGVSNISWSYKISPDGKYILAGANNGEMILWDFNTGQELFHLTAHTQPAYSVAFSPDSRSAFSVSSDGLLVQWRLHEFSLPELIRWVQANRYVRELTREERQRYRIEPLCKE